MTYHYVPMQNAQPVAFQYCNYVLTDMSISYQCNGLLILTLGYFNLEPDFHTKSLRMNKLSHQFIPAPCAA